MPGRTGSAVMTTLAPSAVDPTVADTLPAVGRSVSGTGVSDTGVSGTAVSDAVAVADDWPVDDWPADDGPADNGPGLVVSWTGGVSIDQVLSAVRRYQRHRAGLDLPAWGEVGHSGKPDGQSAGDPGAGPQDDELGEEAATAAHQDRGRVLSVAALGGHAIMPPGPDLAGWLACSRASERDDAALVTSITAWRKVTSWAQAQELAAVAELARRRRVVGTVDAGGQDCDRAADAGDRDPVADTGRDDRDPVAELEAGFAPNEVALALTLTQGGAEYWMDLAVSLTRRLPATLAALDEGTIDLNRAKLIDQCTSSLDARLARTVERRVLVRAEHQTTGQLRASLQRAVLAADPAAAERRRQEAQRRAWVALFGDHDGTASLSGRLLPAAQAAAAWARICAMAKAMEAAGAGGGMDLLRAQVFVGLLLGTLPLIPPSDGGPEDAGPGDGGLENDGGPEDVGPDDDPPGGDVPGGGGPENAGPDDGGPGGGGPEDAGPDDGAPGGDAPGWQWVWRMLARMTALWAVTAQAAAGPRVIARRTAARAAPSSATVIRTIEVPATAAQLTGSRMTAPPVQRTGRAKICLHGLPYLGPARPPLRAAPARLARARSAYRIGAAHLEARPWPGVPCSACRGGPWPDGAASPVS